MLVKVYLFNYTVFSFSLCSGVEAKRGVDFRHSTRNASRVGEKWGTEYFNTSFPPPCCVRDTT